MTSPDIMSNLIELREAVIVGDGKRTTSLTRQLLLLGVPPYRILEDGLISAMDRAASDTAKGLRYIPEDLITARALGSAMELLRPVLRHGGGDFAGTVIIGATGITGKFGDGAIVGLKNCGGNVLEIANFKVVDLDYNERTQDWISCAAELLHRRQFPHVALAIWCGSYYWPSITQIVKGLTEMGLRKRVSIVLTGWHRIDAQSAKSLGVDACANDHYGVLLKIRQLLGHLSRLYLSHAVPQEMIEVTDAISVELIRYLRKNPDALYVIKPRQFERIVAEIFAQYGCEVHLTPSTRDGGYDLYVISRESLGLRTCWIVECKKYAPDRKVGIDIVRSLYAVKAEKRVGNALLATTSHFTKGVKDFKASRYDFELRDYEGIVKWLRAYVPHPGGQLYYRG